MLRKGGCVEKVVEVAPSFEYRFPSVEYRAEIASFGRLSETMKPRVEWRPGRRRFREERFRLTVKALGVFMHAHRDNARVRTRGEIFLPLLVINPILFPVESGSRAARVLAGAASNAIRGNWFT